MVSSDDPVNTPDINEGELGVDDFYVDDIDYQDYFLLPAPEFDGIFDIFLPVPPVVGDWCSLIW